jgi:TRAP-type C4-dicarboxylate transport system permease small subunit
MTGPQRTLLVILAFVALILGSFIWFISTWDASKEEPVTHLPAAYAGSRGTA